MGRRYNYNLKYRGRQEGSPVLKALVILLAILLALGVAFLFFVTARYLEYTDDGPKLNLPWLKDEPDQPSAPNMSDLIIADGEPGPSGSAAPGPSASATPEPVTQPLRAVTVEPAAVLDGSAQARAAQAGANAIVVRVKDEEGNLAWQSSLTLAQEDMNGDAAFNEAVRQLSGSGGLHLTAQISAFQDLWTGVYIRDLAILNTKGKLWYDSDGMSWISVSNEAARTYITNLCLELAGMGFDEILLEHAGYPDSGRTYNIKSNENYPAQSKEAAGAYLQELSQKLGESGVSLSVLVHDEQPDPADQSGLTPAALAGLSGRVWLPKEADPSVWVQALTGAGLAGGADRVVPAEPLPDGVLWTGSRLVGAGT